MSSGYLRLPRRTPREARRDIARKADGWTQPTLDELNEEFRQRAVWRNSPEGRAQTAAFAKFCAEEDARGDARFIERLIVGAATVLDIS